MAIFVKIEKGLVSKEEFDPFVADHLKYIEDLCQAGRQVVSGYWGSRGGGLMCFEADSREEAEEIVKNDPLVKNLLVEYQIKEWVIAAGQMNLKKKEDL